MNFICPFQHDQHHRIFPEILGWARDNCPDRDAAKNLFMYRHKIHQTFVIALWVKEGWFVDVMNLGMSLGNFTQTSARVFREMFDSEHTVDGFKKQMAKKEYDFNRKQTDLSGNYHDRLQQARSNTTQVGYSGS